MQEALNRLVETSSAVKHMIILSDGLTDQGDFETLTKQAKEHKITVTTVAVGTDSDRELMEKIALWGGGRSYYTADFKNIPRIFTAETIIVSRGLVIEETFFPYVSSGSEILEGINTASLPPQRGYVRTYLKSGATQVLAADDESPILATTRFGLGRSAAFTSNFHDPWGDAWIRWELFPKFAAQLVRCSECRQTPQRLNISIDE